MQIVYAVLIFYMGMLWTSFGMLVAQRLPKKQSLMGHSVCDHCQHPLTLWEVLPLFGYLFRKGKCGYCHQMIKPCYPITELIGGFLFFSAYLIDGFSWRFAGVAVFLCIMLIEVFSDLRSQIVIDRIWIIGIVPLLIIRSIEGAIVDSLISGAVMFTLMFLIAYLGHMITKKEALGGGDVKLYLFVGAFLTWPLGLLSLFFTSLLGFLYGKIWVRNDQHTLPLVPFMMIGALLAFYIGDDMLAWYVNLLRM